MAQDEEAAARLLAKLRRFASEALEPDERVLLAVLLAPGIQAMTEPDDVEGFTFTRVGNAALVEGLREGVRRSRIRVVGFGEERDRSSSATD